jgi:hypothetical protein
MRISFDLDDTLICYGAGVPCESVPPWYRRILVSGEPLRQGARELLQGLHRRGWELWIYTTSLRTPRAIRRWLRSYGIPIAAVVNQAVHDRCVRRNTNDNPPSKNPAAFEIDLHVDDSEGVRIEGIRFGFEVVVISPNNLNWTDEILSATHQFEQSRLRHST